MNYMLYQKAFTYILQFVHEREEYFLYYLQIIIYARRDLAHNFELNESLEPSYNLATTYSEKKVLVSTRLHEITFNNPAFFMRELLHISVTVLTYFP
jgi:hypothetical protein